MPGSHRILLPLPTPYWTILLRSCRYVTFWFCAPLLPPCLCLPYVRFPGRTTVGYRPRITTHSYTHFTPHLPDTTRRNMPIRPYRFRIPQHADGLPLRALPTAFRARCTLRPHCLRDVMRYLRGVITVRYPSVTPAAQPIPHTVGRYPTP